MRNACISLILIFILLLIFVSILKEKQNHTETVYRKYMINNDINYNIANVFLKGWYSAILVKDEDRLLQMIHPKAQINTFVGNGKNALEALDISKRIDILPDYKISKINTTLTNHNMVVSHTLKQYENNNQYTSVITLSKDTYLKWKVLSWSFFRNQ